MNINFIAELAECQVSIPPEASRIAGLFLILQATLIVFQKKNNPERGIWEDISGVLLAGLFVFLFPELVKFSQILFDSLSFTSTHIDVSSILEAQQRYNEQLLAEYMELSPDELTNEHFMAFWNTQYPNDQISANFLLANWVLKPLADFINTLCFPTFWVIRAVSIRILIMLAPLILILGAFPSFRSLWKHWFLIYFALLASGPALIFANSFCEDCFTLYIKHTDSPILGFIMIALARFKAFQSVMDFCSRLFRV